MGLTADSMFSWKQPPSVDAWPAFWRLRAVPPQPLAQEGEEEVPEKRRGKRKFRRRRRGRRKFQCQRKRRGRRKFRRKSHLSQFWSLQKFRGKSHLKVRAGLKV